MSSPSSSSSSAPVPAPSSSRVVSLPYVNVQPDFSSVIRDVAQSVVRKEDFWVSCYVQGREGVHGKVHCTTDEDGDLLVTTSGGVQISRIGEETTAPIQVSFPTLKVGPTTIRQQKRRIASPLHPKALSTLSLSPHPDHPSIVLGGDDGLLSVLSLASSSSSSSSPTPTPLALKGAVGDVLSTRFFPSGQVTLSTTLSSQILVHSALPGPGTTEPVRVLKAHTRAVTCSAILGRGKHVLSGSKDKTVKRWDVAEARVAGSVEFGDEVWSLILEESGLAAWVGLKSGGVWRVDLAEGGGVTHADVGIEGGRGEGGVEAMAIQNGVLATGTSSGILSLFRLSSDLTPPTLIAKVRRSTGSISSLAFLPDGRLVVGGEDGMPWIAGADVYTREDGTKTWGVSEELAGFEDAIVGVAVDETTGEIWVGAKTEGVARY